MAIQSLEDSRRANADYLAYMNAPPVVTTEVAGSVMDSASMQALQQLINSLAAQQTSSMANTQATTQQAKTGAESYSKKAAFADSQAAMQAQMAKVLQTLMPQLVRSSEGAGTSQNSMLALLQQQAASDAANQAATLGIKTAVDYGQIATGLLNAATQSASVIDPTTAALLSALDKAKGVTTKSTTTATTSKGSNEMPTLDGIIGKYTAPTTANRSGNPYARFSF